MGIDIETLESATAGFGRSRIALLVLVLLAARPAAEAAGAQGRAVVFGVDGLSTAGVADADTPNMHMLMKSGSWTMHMRGVRETSSSPNWAAQIMGAPVELTGVISNGWQPNDGKTFTPACTDAPGIFPTIFGLAHQQYPKMKIGVFTDWRDYVRLFEPNVTTRTYASGVSEFDAFDHALEYLESDRPEFLFIHVDFVDHAGHTKGWDGPEYLAAVQQADHLLGRLLDMLDQLNLRKATTVLVVSDHGGRSTHHGGDSMAEIEIPWIISGPGIRVNYELQARNLLQYDTAATIARILKVEPSPCWRAVPIDEAFAKKK